MRERFIRDMSPSEIAVLALVRRWHGWDLGEKMGVKTVAQLIADGADLNGRTLATTLANLEAKGLLEVRKARLSRKTSASWTSAGSSLCYAYLNDWGWESLAMALEGHRPLGHGGPPYLGGPGYGGWSAADN